MAKKLFRRKFEEDFGWFTTLPLPKKISAELIATDYRNSYEQVEIIENLEGWSVRYRKPKERK